MGEFWLRLKQKYGHKRVNRLALLAVVGLAFVPMYMLEVWELYHSALLYVLVPYCVSIAITLFRSYDEPSTVFKRYLSHCLTALTVLLGTSLLVGEGFICIIFFAPIYLIVVSITYWTMAISKRRQNGRKYALVLPVIIVALAAEGTTASLSMPRYTSVEVSRTTSLSVEEVKANIAKPFSLEKQRHWLISIFPMPYRIEAGSLSVGDIHTVYTRYHRWFVTNTHEGRSDLLIESVESNRIRTKVLSDSTYFSTYLSGTGTEINLIEEQNGDTTIQLTLFYRRNLDPAWYFHPLQKFGVSKMGELIIDQLMIRS